MREQQMEASLRKGTCEGAEADPPLTQVMQQLLGSVLGGLQVEQLLVLVDELGVDGGVEELVVGQDVLQEGDVGLDADREGNLRHFTQKIMSK